MEIVVRMLNIYLKAIFKAIICNILKKKIMAIDFFPTKTNASKIANNGRTKELGKNSI